MDAESSQPSDSKADPTVDPSDELAVAPTPDIAPTVRIGDRERDLIVRRLESAMAEGYLTFEEMESRMSLAYRARTESDLAKLTQDLPATTAARPAPTTSLGGFELKLIGDIKRGGWLAVPTEVRAISLIGDVTIDLSSATLPPDGVDLTVVSLIGDVTVIVADGTPVHTQMVSLVGDRREAVSAFGPASPDVRLKGVVLVGDLKVYSISQVPAGRLREWWASIRQRALGAG